MSLSLFRVQKYFVWFLFLFSMFNVAQLSASLVKINQKRDVKLFKSFNLSGHGCPNFSLEQFGKYFDEFYTNKKLGIDEVHKKLVEHKILKKAFVHEFTFERGFGHHRPLLEIKCLKPYFKADVIDSKDQKILYQALINESSEVIDPNYEVHLRTDELLRDRLPGLAITQENLNNKNLLDRIIKVFEKVSENKKFKVSEAIIDAESQSMTIILSYKNRPISVFLGKDFWQVKTEKLQKVINYMSQSDTMPQVINLTNHEKMVVKFADRT